MVGAICAVVIVRVELPSHSSTLVHHCLAKPDTTLQMNDLTNNVYFMEADPGNETLVVLKRTVMNSR